MISQICRNVVVAMRLNNREHRSHENGTSSNSARIKDSAFAATKAPPRREEVAEGQKSESIDFFGERHYSVAELAKLWNLSKKTIRRMFEHEPGVLQWGSAETQSKRSYMTLRIPETVALRLHRRLRIAG
jgi:hypothetical protein